MHLMVVWNPLTDKAVVQEAVPGRAQEVHDWFRQALDVRCCLVRQQPGSRKPVNPAPSDPTDGVNLPGHIGEFNSAYYGAFDWPSFGCPAV